MRTARHRAFLTIMTAVALSSGVPAAELIALYQFATSVTADVAGASKRGAYAGTSLNGSVGVGAPTVSGGALVLDGSSTVNFNLSSTVAANPLSYNRDWTITFRFKTSTNAADFLKSGTLFMWIGRDGALRMDVYNNYGITSDSAGLANGLWHTASLTYLHNPPAPGYPHHFMRVDGSAPVADNGDATSLTGGEALVTLGLLSSHYDDATGNVKFKGQIDDLAFFQGVLDSTELANVRAGDYSAYLNGSGPPKLTAMSVLAPSTFCFTLQGEAARTYSIESSINLIEWSEVTQVTTTGAATPVAIPMSYRKPSQYFRAVLVP